MSKEYSDNTLHCRTTRFGEDSMFYQNYKLLIAEFTLFNSSSTVLTYGDSNVNLK